MLSRAEIIKLHLRELQEKNAKNNSKEAPPPVTTNPDANFILIKYVAATTNYIVQSHSILSAIFGTVILVVLANSSSKSDMNFTLVNANTAKVELKIEKLNNEILDTKVWIIYLYYKTNVSRGLLTRTKSP